MNELQSTADGSLTPDVETSTPSCQFTLSVVDQSPMRRGGTPAEALAESVKLAQEVELLGYKRYWVAEHHSAPDFSMRTAIVPPSKFTVRLALS